MYVGKFWKASLLRIIGGLAGTVFAYHLLAFEALAVGLAVVVWQ